MTGEEVRLIKTYLCISHNNSLPGDPSRSGRDDRKTNILIHGVFADFFKQVQRMAAGKIVRELDQNPVLDVTLHLRVEIVTGMTGKRTGTVGMIEMTVDAVNETITVVGSVMTITAAIMMITTSPTETISIAIAGTEENTTETVMRKMTQDDGAMTANVMNEWRLEENVKGIVDGIAGSRLMTGTMTEMDVRGGTVGVKDGTMRKREMIVEKRRKRRSLLGWMIMFLLRRVGESLAGRVQTEVWMEFRLGRRE